MTHPTPGTTISKFDLQARLREQDCSSRNMSKPNPTQARQKWQAQIQTLTNSAAPTGLQLGSLSDRLGLRLCLGMTASGHKSCNPLLFVLADFRQIRDKLLCRFCSFLALVCLVFRAVPLTETVRSLHPLAAFSTSSRFRIYAKI